MLAAGSAPARRRSALVAVVMVFTTAMGAGCSSDAGNGQGPGTTGPAKPGGTTIIGRPATAVAGMLPIAPIYASKNGVLHLRVKAEQVSSSIAGQDYSNIFTYDTSLVDDQGTYTPGTASAYVGPEWHVDPGDKIVVDYINSLPDAEFQPLGSKTPEHVPHPINLHTHGLTVAPSGNSDNVLLSIPQGRSNEYTIDIPKDHQHGLYWYHSHIHGISDDDVYFGMAGHIVVGRADGDYKEFDGLPVVPMMVRYNVAQPNAQGQLIDASPWDTKGTATEPRGKMIYTVNGAVAPRIKLNAADPAKNLPAESQVWAFTNITGSASYVLALDEVDAAQANDLTVAGKPVDFRVVSIDGTAMPTPIVKSGADAARGYLLGQGGRVAIEVDGASDPSKVIRVIQVDNRGGTGEASAYDWPNQKPIGGYRDYTRDILAFSANDYATPGKHVDTPMTLTPNYTVENQPLETANVEQERDFYFNGVAPATPDTPNNFPVDFSLFPDTPIAQPRVGTVEEWTIYNYSSLHHPFHLHTQYGEVMRIVSPVNPDFKNAPGDLTPVQYVTDMSQAQPAPYNQDIVNVPPAEVGADGMPTLGPDGRPAHPGVVVLRVKIDDYLGTYVEHCHRLPHEDRGMMSMVRSIPRDPILAVPTTINGQAVVNVVRSSDYQTVATITPFDGFNGPVTTAVGDVDGDAVPDVAIASGAGRAATVKVYSGASNYTKVIKTIDAFDGATFGANVALGDLNGDHHDDIVIGQLAGGAPRVSIYDATTNARLADFNAYDATFAGGVSVATGTVEVGGRVSLITGSGPGGPATVNVYNFDLFGDADAKMPDLHASLTPLKVATQAIPGPDGGISVATGYPFATKGGFATVLVSSLGGPTVVSMFAVSGHTEGQIDVSASGVARPHDYEPDGHQLLTSVATVDFTANPSIGNGAWLSAISTVTGAHLVSAPVGGGPIVVWDIDPTKKEPGPLQTLFVTGTGVAGI